MDQVAAQRGGGLTSLSFFVTYVVIGVAAVVLAWALRGWQVGLAVLMLALVGRMVVATASHLRPIPAAGHATFGEPGEPIPWDVRVPASVRLVSNSICLVGLAGCCTVLVWKATVEEHWCVPVAILLLGVVVAVLDGVQRFRDKAASDRGWASPFLRTLRSSGIFTKIRVEEERPFLTLPGLRMAASGPEPSGVHLKVRSLTARSTATRATLTLSLWRYAPPDGTPAECRVLPPRWVTLSVTSEEAVLGGLPAGPRRRRHEGRVIWVLSGTELDRGELDDLIGRVGATLGGLPSAPYR